MKPLAALVALACMVLGILYLLGWLQLGTSHPGPHPTHAIVFFVLAILALLWLRFASGASRSTR